MTTTTATPRTTWTTALGDDVEPAPAVTVQRHAYDFNDLAGGVDHRIITVIGQNPGGCHYFNPAVTISCPHPTPAFFAKVRQEQARWCRIASQTFKKRERRRVKSWITHDRVTNKYARYLDRAACFTGILFIDGELVPAHKWRNRLHRHSIFRRHLAELPENRSSNRETSSQSSIARVNWK